MFWDASECPLTVRSTEWLEDEGVLWFRDKIYVLRNADLQRRVVFLCYDTKVAEYPGDGDQREFDLETRVTTNGNRIISKMLHSCALNK